MADPFDDYFDKLPEANLNPWFDIEDMEDEACLQQAARRFQGYLSALENNQRKRLTDLMKYVSIYHSSDLCGSSPFVRMPSVMPRQILNISRAVVDALVAKHVVNESKPTFDVSDGDWEADFMAQDLDKFVFGEFYRAAVYEEHEKAFRDAAICGDGWVHFFAENGKVACERVFPLEMFLDPAACVSAAPRELTRVRYIDRQTAMSLYGEDLRERIAKLPSEKPTYPHPGPHHDLVRIAAAWHLPDNVEGDNGVYLLTCGDIVLQCTPYKRPRFPFVRMTWGHDFMGGYGYGLIQNISTMQAELNKLKMKHLIGLHIHAVPRTWQQAGSTFTPELNDDGSTVYRYTGTKPEVDLSPCAAPELVVETKELEAQIWLLAGVSPVESGQSTLSRVDSRPGLREYAALSDEKHAMPSRTWDRSFTEAARQIIDIATEIVEDRGSYYALGRAKDFVVEIDFKHCMLENDRFTIKIQNTNLLPSTPAGKRLAITEFSQAGLFKDPAEAWQLLAGSPDIDATIRRHTVQQRLVKKQMYYITNKQQYFAPDTHQDMSVAIPYARYAQQEFYMKSNEGTDRHGKPSKKAQTILNLFEQFIMECDDINKANQPPPSMMPPQQMMPPGGGPPPPGAPPPPQGMDPNAGSNGSSPGGVIPQ